jgi:hypothetical protein
VSTVPVVAERNFGDGDLQYRAGCQEFEHGMHHGLFQLSMSFAVCNAGLEIGGQIAAEWQ